MAKQKQMTESERVEATAAAAEAVNAAAPEVDPLSLMPWERHEDVDPPQDFDAVLGDLIKNAEQQEKVDAERREAEERKQIGAGEQRLLEK